MQFLFVGLYIINKCVNYDDGRLIWETAGIKVLSCPSYWFMWTQLWWSMFIYRFISCKVVAIDFVLDILTYHVITLIEFYSCCCNVLVLVSKWSHHNGVSWLSINGSDLKIKIGDLCKLIISFAGGETGSYKRFCW